MSQGKYKWYRGFIQSKNSEAIALLLVETFNSLLFGVSWCKLWNATALEAMQNMEDQHTTTTSPTQTTTSNTNILRLPLYTVYATTITTATAAGTTTTHYCYYHNHNSKTSLHSFVFPQGSDDRYFGTAAAIKVAQAWTDQ